MKKKVLRMSEVTKCEMSECAYNLENDCHALAITVGDGASPACDTFFSAQDHTSGLNQLAGVGACKVSSCLHNKAYECMAPDIMVGMSGNRASCLTFQH